MSLLVMVSALGAINGLIFTYSRVFSSMGAEYNLFAILGRWNRRLGAPVWTLLLQGLFSVILIVLVGTEFGRQQIDRLLLPVGWNAKNWEQYHGGFDTLVAATAPVFWSFFLMTGLAFFALRERDAPVTRPFRVPFHPLFPLIFCGTCIFMLYSALEYVKMLALIGAVPVAVGLPLYWLARRTRPEWEETPASQAVPPAPPRPAGLEESPPPASEPPADDLPTETHLAPAPTADGGEEKETENPFRTFGSGPQ
jgi:amino acid transporter